MTAKKVLIVDDEADICELIEITLMRMDIASQSALNLTDARLLLDTEHFDLCLTDMRLPDGDGVELVEYVQQNHPELPIAVITAHGNMESAVKALKAGAFDFVSKPVDIQILRSLVSAATALPQDIENNKKDNNKISITGESNAVKSLLKNISKLARNQAPVFIHGESGSGKERVARMIHQQGSRCEGPFVPVNCGAIPAELMESEFFGHVKGAFTGAIANKPGKFELAHRGTVFLDEIGTMALDLQGKLLRVLQDGEFIDLLAAAKLIQGGFDTKVFYLSRGGYDHLPLDWTPDGELLYDIGGFGADPQSFIVYEKYEDDAAFAEHGKNLASKGGEFGALMAGAPQIVMMEEF